MEIKQIVEKSSYGTIIHRKSDPAVLCRIGAKIVERVDEYGRPQGPAFLIEELLTDDWEVKNESMPPLW